MGAVPITMLLIRAAQVAGIMAFVVVFINYLRVLKQRQKLPPGPFPWPIVGNHFQIELPRPWLYMLKVSKHYDNPMITIWHGHHPNIICNDIWTITDLLDKRSNICSSRPHMAMLGDPRGATHSDQACLAYGERWRHHRRLTHQFIGSQAVRKYRPFQSAEVNALLQDLLNDPDRFVKAIERYSVSVVSYIGFYRRVARLDDNVARVAMLFMEGVDLVMPGMFLMETIPALLKAPRWIYPAAQKAIYNGSKIKTFFTSLAREASLGPRTESNFSATLFEEKKATGLREEEISFLTGNLIGGGVATFASTTITFILAMCAFPEVQAQAHECIDRAVGDRLPEWEDEESLQYIRACVEESLRWRTGTILEGIPHAPIQDDIYRDYSIPKGTWITGNMWSIHRDPNCFPDPDVFRPERFIDRSGQPGFPVKKGHSAYGWGRRQCSGQPLAEQGSFLTMARLLWAFDVGPGIGPDGKEVPVDIFAYGESENMRPEPFKARFTPRSQHRKAQIEEQASRAYEFLRQYDGETKVVLEDLEA